jgi:hypothetical protein
LVIAKMLDLPARSATGTWSMAAIKVASAATVTSDAAVRNAGRVTCRAERSSG